MPFSISIGDVIALCELAIKIGEAAIQAPKEFKELKEEIEDFQELVDEIAPLNDHALSQTARRLFDRIDEKVNSYQAALDSFIENNPQPNNIKERLKWALRGAERARLLREQLARYHRSLSMRLVRFYHQQQADIWLQYHSAAPIRDLYPNLATITIVDPVGKHVSFPLLFCNTYSLLLDALPIYYKHNEKLPGRSFVLRGDYQLVHEKTREIIEPGRWSSILSDRLVVEMSMVLRQQNAVEGACPRCRTLFEGDAVNGWALCAGCDGQFQIQRQIQEVEVSEHTVDEVEEITSASVTTSMRDTPKGTPRLVDRTQSEWTMFRLISIISITMISITGSTKEQPTLNTAEVERLATEIELYMRMKASQLANGSNDGEYWNQLSSHMRSFIETTFAHAAALTPENRQNYQSMLALAQTMVDELTSGFPPGGRTPTFDPSLLSDPEFAGKFIMRVETVEAMNPKQSHTIDHDTRTQLFVGNLPYRVRSQDLKGLFSKAGGTVLSADVSLGPGDRSRGYGTVLLESAEDAHRAIDMFNGYVWQTRTLEVRLDKLPNDFGSSGVRVDGGPMSRLSHSLSPQPVPYANSFGAPAAIYPLRIASESSPASAATLSFPNSHSSSAGGYSASNLTDVPSALTQETSILSKSNSVWASILEDKPRSSGTIGLPRTPSLPSSGFTNGSSWSALRSQTPTSSSKVKFASKNPPCRTILIENWPSQYGKSDFDQIFRRAGTILQSKLSASNGSDNLSYGTVVYTTEEAAKNAVVQLHGLEPNGRRLSIRIGEPDQLSKSQSTASQERRKSDEMHLSTTPAPLVVPTATKTSYGYPSHISMPPPMPPIGYLMASPPHSPYDQVPLVVADALPSPTSTYPPPLNGGIHTYGIWSHQPHKPPSPTVSLGGSNSSSGVGASGSTAPTTNGWRNRIPPGSSSLPNPSLTDHPPPEQMSPTHLPAVTPSVPSFTFLSQPMPTSTVHPPYQTSSRLSSYSLLGSPGLYRYVKPYFNLSPGAPVPYHHDANAVTNNGVIGSGVGHL